MNDGKGLYHELKQLLKEMRLSGPGGRRWAAPGWADKLQAIIDRGEWRVLDNATVPKNREILVFASGRIYQVSWSPIYKTWVMESNGNILMIPNPTHWKEKPDPPQPELGIRVSKDFLVGELTDLQAVAHSGADVEHLNERIDSLVELAQQEFLDDERRDKIS